MSEHIEQLRQVMIACNAGGPVEAADDLLAATYPPACQTCGGTGRKPKPNGWDQMAHLESGTCGCHDSWDQCPCEHHTPGCGCCPGGTGLCGPLPCHDCPTIGSILLAGIAALRGSR